MPLIRWNREGRGEKKKKKPQREKNTKITIKHGS